jgi:signal transduction histidine kinase
MTDHNESATSPRGQGAAAPAKRPPVDRIAVVAVAAVVVLGAFHYAMPGGSMDAGAHHDHGAHLTWHAILRRASTIPIGIAAVAGGMRMGALAAALATVIYLPHAFFADAFSRVLGVRIHADPSSSIERISEIVTYVALGLLLGALTDRAKRERVRATHLDVRLQKTEAELARAERLSSLGELVAGVAHEIRNPLAALVTTGEMLSDAYPEGHPRHRMARLHMDELGRLGRVVERFLSFARPSTPRRHTVAVADVVERATLLLESTARQSEVTIVAHPTTARASVDDEQLVQVLLNLGLNAIQASEKGSTVEIGTSSDEHGRIHIDVSDRGRGVPNELAERVFDPCFTTRPDGSGLGLSIATRIAFAHDGTLTLQPRDGGGTVASLVLPGENRATDREERAT